MTADPDDRDVIDTTTARGHLDWARDLIAHRMCRSMSTPTRSPMPSPSPKPSLTPARASDLRSPSPFLTP
jgi:hypothetical protein